jgi:CRP-like cAMP-binding protein
MAHDDDVGMPEPESFLSGLRPDERGALIERGRAHRWRKGAVLCPQDELSRWVALLTDGVVKSSVHTRDGGEVLLGVHGPGALVGGTEAADGRPRTATIAALEPVEALVVPRPAFLDFLRTHDNALWFFVAHVCRELRDAERARVAFAAGDVAGRLVRLLVDLAERFGLADERGLRISLALTQHELAGWVGASREAVSAALATLRSRGWIETGRRTVVVRDLGALREMGQR